MIILGIETSCDETSLCLLEKKGEQYKVHSHLIHSQIDLHKEFGGVFPMLAKREHIKNLPILYEKVIKESGISEASIDRIAVTQGPGLEPALWTGILFSQELGKRLDIPVIPVNHMEGHIMSTFINEDMLGLKNVSFPALALLISGGHTELVHMEGIGKYKILGATVDDAVGEAFDKVARMMNIPYPGGPEISKLAEEARKENTPHEITLPRPMIHSKDLNFSFSGLKTSVLYTLKKIGTPSADQMKDIAREFEDAVTEVLVEKTKSALDEHGASTLIVAGGVSANTHIREAFKSLASEYSTPLLLPAKGLSGDNALMIALVGVLTDAEKPSSTSEEGFTAKGNMSL